MITSGQRVCALVAVLASSLACADDHAADIIRHIDGLYRGNSSTATMVMTVVTPEFERSMTMDASSLGTENVLIRILEPRKDRGITTLKTDNEMWNFFPKINRTFKVPPSMMMSSWMGSDFTNDDIVRETDLTSQYQLEMSATPTKYTITLTPRENAISVWGRIEYLVDRVAMLPITQTYFDDRGEQVRVIRFSERETFGNHTVPALMEVTPVRKPGHRTTVRFKALKLDPDGLSMQDFSLRNLKKRI